MYSLPKETSIVFHIGSNYGYPFCQFTCLGENTEKYITFSVPIEKEVTRIDKMEEEITKNMFYRLQFMDSRRFMASFLSNLVNNLSEGIHINKCK